MRLLHKVMLTTVHSVCDSCGTIRWLHETTIIILTLWKRKLIFGDAMQLVKGIS